MEDFNYFFKQNPFKNSRQMLGRSIQPLRTSFQRRFNRKKCLDQSRRGTALGPGPGRSPSPDTDVLIAEDREIQELAEKFRRLNKEEDPGDTAENALPGVPSLEKASLAQSAAIDGAGSARASPRVVLTLGPLAPRQVPDSRNQELCLKRASKVVNQRMPMEWKQLRLSGEGQTDIHQAYQQLN